MGMECGPRSIKIMVGDNSWLGRMLSCHVECRAVKAEKFAL